MKATRHPTGRSRPTLLALIASIAVRTDSAQEGFEPSVPRLRWSSVQLAARDATHAAVVKRGTPDPFAATSSASDFPHAWRAFHMDKSRR